MKTTKMVLVVIAIGMFLTGVSYADNPAGAYKPLYPISSGGEACTTPECVAKLTPPKAPIVQKRVASNPDTMGGRDNTVAVKGNDNDVTPQNIKQQQRMKTSIKGNSNTVKKLQSQIGVNVKTTGKESPVTVNVYGGSIDGKCPPDGNCQTQVTVKKDKDGNIIQEQSKQEKTNLNPAGKISQEQSPGVAGAITPAPGQTPAIQTTPVAPYVPTPENKRDAENKKKGGAWGEWEQWRPWVIAAILVLIAFLTIRTLMMRRRRAREAGADGGQH